MGIEEKIRDMNLKTGAPIEIRYWNYQDNGLLPAIKTYWTQISYFMRVENGFLYFNDTKELALDGSEQISIALNEDIEGITEIRKLSR